VDADIDRVLHDLQERTATLEPVTRPAQLTDTVTLNVTGRVEGEEVLNREDMEFPLQDVESDSHSALPGLSAELVGVNRGEIREIALPFPDGYPEEALAGKTMFLRALVKEIKRRVLPELDDDFAKTLSDAETLDELRGRLRANLEAERRREADEKLVNAAIEQVSERTFLEIPPVLVDEELDRMVKDVRASFERSQYSFEHYLEAAHTTEEAMRDEYREGATQNVKTSLVVGAVADLENIDISNAEVTAALEEILRTSKMSVGEQRRLRQSNSVRSNIRGRIRRQRAIQQLVAVMTDGEEVGSEAADALVDQTADPSADTQETIAVEVGG
ncbi:MAG: trigger factor, partial [Chloroflexota bacterium]